ncbi:DUF2293 domain-containing protein [Thiocapsa bogorovii]|uniref:DUF2293 domain-containing protein n=1 Tax=Thiocapsa bogorovii TaxID=521689 RepID=UPI0038CD7656
MCTRPRAENAPRRALTALFRLTRAETECDADAATRAARRNHAAARRAELGQDYVTRFAARVRELYPHCPDRRETAIAEHACRKYSGRIGRSGSAESLDPEAIDLAVIAHIRHTETPYDDLLLRGHDRHDARARVRDLIDEVLRTWAERRLSGARRI